jgi:hypothetical protein
MSPRNVALISWLLVTALFAIVGGVHIVPQLIDLYDLAKSNRVTQGEIIATYPHLACEYRYSVEGRPYEHTGRYCGGGGQHITVYYSPDDPAKSINDDPWELFKNDLFPFVVALIAFPLLVAIASYLRAQRRKGSA